MEAHNSGKGAKYTKARRPVELAYYEEFETKEQAMKREYAIKQLGRKEKQKLIAGKKVKLSDERKGRRCEMDNREKIIRLWFDMWLAKKDLGIFNVFSDNAVYIESWGPEYHGSKKIKLWFEEWNTRGTGARRSAR